MTSGVTARQFSHFNSHKMHQKQHEGLLKRMYMPFVRGPEDRHFFTSFHDKCSNAFLKSNPFIRPEDKSYLLAPHRDDLPIINPSSGFVSPGGAVEANQIMYSKNKEPLGNGKDVQPPPSAPFPHTTHQPANRRLSVLEEIKQDQQWNSRAVPDISLRSKLGGWTSSVKVIPAPPKVKENFSPHRFAFHVDPDIKSSDPSSEAFRDEKARKYMYTSVAQRANEDIPWDRMLPPKVKPPDSTLEPRADRVSQRFSMKQYEPEAETSQVVGSLWDRFQRRAFISPDKPINFVSPCSRTQHLPLYTGCVGAENPDDLDNPYVDVIVHSRVRNAEPQYVKSSYSPNTSGYTGKVHWSATQPANSNLPPTSPSIISRMYCYLAKHGQPSEFPHLGPLSQTLVPTEPQNPFNKKEKKRIEL
ncbi:spermatogenesis-associated protein 48 [Podarcis raffonei]|uniref:spermatogenesis-associated protein 48 n=1 Tax=Podarcis raffonei TaxID=65483 RepID=UPI00232989E6|nr:spermatogenesis-associated protein 48 [Podarcis raffonei]